MPPLKVSYGAFDTAHAAFNTAMNNLMSLLDNMQTANTNLTAPDVWKGCGSDEYLASANKCHDQALQSVQDLKPMQDYLNNSKDGYQQAGTAAINAFS